MFTEISPLSQGMCESRNSISSILLPLPIQYKNTQSSIKCFRLSTCIHLELNLILFTLDPIYLNPYISRINDCDTLNYCEDIRSVIHNTYSLPNVTFTEELGMQIFRSNLNTYDKEYSLLEIKSLLFIYNNPIRYVNNYIVTSSIKDNLTYNYPLMVKSTLFYFSIGLNIDETKCVTRIWWEGYSVYEGFCHKDLQEELNQRLWSYLPDVNLNNTSDYPLRFKYFKKDNNHILESECVVEGNIHIKGYLTSLLTGRLVYTTEHALMRFLHSYSEQLTL